MGSFQDSSSWVWEDYNLIEEVPSTGFSWLGSTSVGIGKPSKDAGCEKVSLRKRGPEESFSGPGTKACREKMRRDRMNDRFLELSCVLEPGRPPKTDKSAILCDAIRVLNQLRTEIQELKNANEKLQEDITNLKAEKNELRDEKLKLKGDKEILEKQIKGMSAPSPPFLAHHPTPVFAAPLNKTMAFPHYNGMAMWQWMPPSAVDTSQDHVLRSPVA
ncbi:hypothetical protein AMTRI_Chr07g80320 [Amborella trichopoda]|uniref:BHLH domain-containing protein n=1 Tax=Amborella trichopoda TaxID=13333 RepID=W1NHE2_AMBTC|nr:transcription factor ILR3 [Amborella trichopoda]ERM94918.1 hypothetical protein AMTR_s00009p00175450 [Amborella trichopoda]|eukprot:XP_006827502.1 transcription factor ILR3 [Amborella trichopoda]